MQEGYADKQPKKSDAEIIKEQQKRILYLTGFLKELLDRINWALEGD